MNVLRIKFSDSFFFFFCVLGHFNLRVLCKLIHQKTNIKWWDIDSLNLLVYVSCFFLCYAVLIVPCSIFITCLERVYLLTLLCVVFSYLFVTFQYGVLGQVWYLMVSIPDLCLPLYFNVLEQFSYVIKILCYHIWRTILVVFNDSIKLLS